MREVPPGPLLDDVAHPVERLDILDEGRAAEQADLGDIGRPVARHGALALDQFDHRQFFAADISPGAAAQMHGHGSAQPRPVEPVQFLAQHQIEFGIFVAQVDVDLVRFHGPGGEEHAFDDAMRIAFQIMAVLEGARLAFVGVDAHQSRSGLGAHEAPLPPGGKARAA